MNPILDALSGAAYLADTPGAYLRGALSGRPGERASGREMLQNWGVAGENQPGLDWGDVGGFGAEMVLDPLSLAAPALGAIKGLHGIQAGTKAAQGLAHADDASPLVKAMAGFAGDEAGAIAHPEALRLLREQDNPLGRFGALSEPSPAQLSVNTGIQETEFPHGMLHGTMAAYLPNEYNPTVVPNLHFDQWGSPEAMEEMVRRNVRSGFGTGPVSADSYPVHEIGHAFHDSILRGHGLPGKLQSMADSGQLTGPVADDIRRHLGEYATSNPAEFIAEAFTKQMLRGEPLPPYLRSLYQDLQGPDLDKLPPEFLRTFWNLPRL